MILLQLNYSTFALKVSRRVSLSLTHPEASGAEFQRNSAKSARKQIWTIVGIWKESLYRTCAKVELIIYTSLKNEYFT